MNAIATKTLETLEIDPEFRGLLPTHTGDEAAGLDSQLEQEGCEDSIKVWVHKGKKTIVDGHHRYKRCQKEKIPYAVEEKEFGSRAEAINWMIHRQLSQRNLNEAQRSMLVQKLVTTEHGGDRKSENQEVNLTLDSAAALGNVSTSAVKQARKVDEQGSAALKQAAVNGQVAISAAAAVATLPRAEQTKIVKKGPEAVAKKAKEIRAEKPKPGSATKAWNDDTFIEVLGRLANKIDDGFTRMDEAIDECRTLTKSTQADAARVKTSTGCAKTKIHELLGGVEKAFRKWRPKK